VGAKSCSDNADCAASWRRHAWNSNLSLITAGKHCHYWRSHLENMGLAINLLRWRFRSGPQPPSHREMQSTEAPRLEIVARCAARMEITIVRSARCRKLLSIPHTGALASGVPLTPALLQLIQCSMGFGMIHGSKNSWLIPTPVSQRRLTAKTLCSSDRFDEVSFWAAHIAGKDIPSAMRAGKRPGLLNPRSRGCTCQCRRTV